MFGKWKTFLAFSNLYKELINKRDKYYVISNIPYSFVDYFVSTRSNFMDILQLLGDFIEATNTDIKSTFRTKSRVIYIILDEAHLYFPSRWFTTNQMDAIITQLTQCRKRDIKFVLITQKPWLVDKQFRILADYTINMKRLEIPFFDIYKAYYYENPWDIVDINMNVLSDDSSKSSDSVIEQMYFIESEIFRPLSDFFNVFVRFSRWYHILSNEDYNTKYVTWYRDPTRVTIPSLHSYHWTSYLEKFVDDVYYGKPPHIIRPAPPEKKESDRRPKSRRDQIGEPSNDQISEIVDSIEKPLEIESKPVTNSQEYVPSFRRRSLFNPMHNA